MRKNYLILGGIVLAVMIFVLSWAVPSKQEVASSLPTPEVKPKSTQLEYSDLVQSKCLTCHAVQDGQVARISGVRKTPEGWEATISRMKNLWGVQLSGEESLALVKEFSQLQGLAPEEMEKVMYWLTETGSSVEPALENEALQQSCTRCHAGGRALAQFRTEEEWNKLQSFHLGMNPSLVYQIRDINWVETSEQALAYLAEVNKKDSAEWKKWQEANPNYDPAGIWKVIGYQPGVGKYSALTQIEKQGEDFYEQRKVILADGTQEEWAGNVRLFTGYSVRSSLEGQGQRLRGVFNVQAEGKTIVGRWNQVGNKGIYADETYYKVEKPMLLDVWPEALPTSSEGVVRLMASNLPANLSPADVEVGAGLKVVEIVQQAGDDLWVKVATGETPSTVSIGIKGVEASLSLPLFGEVERLEILPEYGMARIGDGNESVKQSVQFEALAYAKVNGQEVKVGAVPVTWSLAEHYTWDVEDDDLQFVGSIHPQTGLFTPSPAGPNPERTWSANNVGNVQVLAEYVDPRSGKKVRGESFLLVSVPKYVNIH